MSTATVNTVSISPEATALFNWSNDIFPVMFSSTPDTCTFLLKTRTSPLKERRKRYPGAPFLASAVAVRRAGLAHRLLVVLQDLDHLGIALALGGDLIPELHRHILDLLPFFLGNGGQLELAAGGAVVGLAPPVPVLAVVVRRIHRELEQRLQMLGHFVPLVRVGEERTRPRARNVVGEVVLGHVCPADRVGLGRAAPGDAI